jgi:biopolymer transport protein ExbB
MNQSMGLAHFWAQGDAVTHGVAILLLIMSGASWTIMLGKLTAHLRYSRSIDRALAVFWDSESHNLALAALRVHDASGAFTQVATDAFMAAEAHEHNAAKGIGAGVDKSDFVARTLQQSMVVAQARVERGLTFLASVGSTAPFVGLFGTVWGIYHALVGLAGATQVVLDKVAGPVGEALIMTAAGLFVAIPAVLAYNACARANRLVMARLEGFAHSLHAYLVGGVRLAPATQQKTPAMRVVGGNGA